jgi:hypothetical protein
MANNCSGTEALTAHRPTVGGGNAVVITAGAVR